MASPVVTAVFICLGATFVQSQMSTCDFPDFVLASSPWSTWKHKILNQGYRPPQPPHYYKFVKNKLTIKEGRVQTDTITCLKEISGKFLVSVERPGQPLVFQCFQFIQRSVNVVQFKKGASGSSASDSLCDDSRLILDDWPLIENRNIRQTYNQCPLMDGFDMTRVFDKATNTEVCQLEYVKGRMESECILGEGLTFDFRKRSCVPKKLSGTDRKNKLTTNCIGSWEDGQYRFIVLFTLRRMTYVLRLPKTIGDNIEAILFRDNVADRKAAPNQTDNYVKIAMKRVRMATHCMDAYPSCASNKALCDTDPTFKKNCPVSCKTCDTAKMTYPQKAFPQKIQGTWWLRNSTSSRNIELVGDTLSIEGFTNFQSVTVDPSYNKAMEYTLYKSFKNGCRPRYACLVVEVPERSKSVIQYKLSQSLPWPQVSGNEICESSHFRSDVAPLRDTFHSTKLKTLITSSTSAHKPVDCNFPGNYTVKITQQGATTPQCEGQLRRPECHVRNTFVLKPNAGCGAIKKYTCLAQFTTPSIQFIITTTGTAQTQTFNCWMFNTISQGTPIFATHLGDCNVDSITRLVSSGAPDYDIKLVETALQTDEYCEPPTTTSPPTTTTPEPEPTTTTETSQALHTPVLVVDLDENKNAAPRLTVTLSGIVVVSLLSFLVIG